MDSAGPVDTVCLLLHSSSLLVSSPTKHINNTENLGQINYPPTANICHTVSKTFKEAGINLALQENQKTLENVLEIWIKPRVVSLQVIVEDFLHFSSITSICDIVPVLKVLLSILLLKCDIKDNVKHIKPLLDFIPSHPAVFTHMFHPCLVESAMNVSHCEQLLNQCLVTATSLHMLSDLDNTDQSNRLLEMELEMGETPLILAARLHAPAAIRSCLRHGARVDTKWQTFHSALEVLLFTPLKSQIVRDEDRAILCLDYFTAVMGDIPQARIFSMEKEEGYFAHIPAYKHILLELYGSPRSLMHLCKLAIRNSLLENCQLPMGIDSLPLPTSVRQYIDLRCE